MKAPIGIILLFFSIATEAQYPKLDSLENLIRKATTDTARINLINEKILTLSEINLDSAVALAKASLPEAKKINYKKGEGQMLQRLSVAQCFKGDYKSAAANLNMAMVIFTESNDSASLATLYSNYGLMYGMQSKYDTAVIYFEKSIDLAERVGNKAILNRAYQNIAISYQMQSDYTRSLIYFQKALTAAEESKDFNTLSYIWMNTGITYTFIGDTVRAEDSFLKAVNFAKKAGTKNVELYAYSNLSTLYDKKNKPQRAYEFAMKAADYAREMGDHGILAASLSKAAISLAQQKNFAKAEQLDREAMAIADSSNQPMNIFQAYSAMGSILKMQKKYTPAITFFEKAFKAMKNADVFDESAGRSYSDLSECYEKTGNYQKALSAYKASAEITDSARSKVNVRKATELALNFEFEKKRQLAEAEQQKQNAVSNTRQYTLLTGLILTLLLAIVAFYGYRNKQKANFLLERQKKEIQSTLSELKSTQTQLIHSEKMASLGELTAGIAHEIQNPLNFVNNFSEVNIELIGEVKESKSSTNELGGEEELLRDIESNLEKILHHGKRADTIVKSMLQHSRATSGQKEPTDINALADEYLRLSYHGLRAKDKTFNATMKTDFDETIDKINILPQDIGRVLLNLYTNAFYSVMEKKESLATAGGMNGSNFEPTVWVGTKRNADEIEITIRDNGLGIPQKVQDKIFQPFFTTKPTGKGTGLGLSLSYDIVTKGHGGQIMIETKEGEYATFIIRLPMAQTQVTK